MDRSAWTWTRFDAIDYVWNIDSMAKNVYNQRVPNHELIRDLCSSCFELPNMLYQLWDHETVAALMAENNTFRKHHKKVARENEQLEKMVEDQTEQLIEISAQLSEAAVQLAETTVQLREANLKIGQLRLWVYLLYQVLRSE